MGHADGQAGLIGERLLLALPQRNPRAFAAAAISGDQ